MGSWKSGITTASRTLSYWYKTGTQFLNHLKHFYTEKLTFLMYSFISFTHTWILVTTTDDIQNNFNISKNTFKMTFCIQTLPPPWTAGNHLSLFSAPTFLPFLECHINGILQYVPIRDWVLSLIIIYIYFIFKTMFIFPDYKIKEENRKNSVTSELTWIMPWHPERNGEVTETRLKDCFPSYIIRAFFV